MGTKRPPILNQRNRLPILLAVAAFLLLIPLIAMQFSSEVNWTFFDFIIAAILLFGAAISIEWILRKITSTGQRIIVCAVFLLILIWMELAVGLFGSPFAGN